MSQQSNHASFDELQEKLAQARTSVEEGTLYRHYRSAESRYRVLRLALQEDTEEPCVVYESLQSPGLVWVRNLSDWEAEVALLNGGSMKRFEQISE